MTVPPRSLHSWWLTPPADHPSRALLASAIDRAAAAASSPRFEPHVTLAGAFVTSAGDATAGGRALASLLPACVGVKFDGVATGTTHHKAAFLTAATTGPLCEGGKVAASLAATVSGGGGGGRFEPHLSLVYTSDAAAAAAVAADATASLRLDEVGWTGGFVEVWATEGEVEGWARVAQFELKG